MYNILINGQTKDNENHRDQLIRDMIYVCCLPGLSAKSRKEFLDKAVIWPLSDKDEENITKSAKYKGCKYWSEDAYNKHIKPYENDESLKGFTESGLTHEHVVPKCIFIDSMEKYFKNLRNEITSENIQEKMDKAFKDLKDIISRNLYACVITKDEDDTKLGGKLKTTMPDGETNFFEIKNPWLRYIKAGYTELYEVNWEPRKTKTEKDTTGWIFKGAKKIKIADISLEVR